MARFKKGDVVRVVNPNKYEISRGYVEGTVCTVVQEESDCSPEIPFVISEGKKKTAFYEEHLEPLEPEPVYKPGDKVVLTEEGYNHMQQYGYAMGVEYEFMSYSADLIRVCAPDHDNCFTFKPNWINPAPKKDEEGIIPMPLQMVKYRSFYPKSYPIIEFKEMYAYINKPTNKKTIMETIKTTIKMALIGEPQKTLVKKGILTENLELTTVGKEAFVEWLYAQNKDAFAAYLAPLLAGDDK